MKFISNFILNNFKDDKYNYIMVIHINRNFNKKNKENKQRIYSILDINPDINQIFIDNLNGNNKMKLNDILKQDIKDILEEKKEDMKLDDEFNKTLTNYLTNELNKTSWDNNDINEYINEIKNYMKEEEPIKEKIFEATYKLIDNNKGDEANCRDIIDKLYSNNYISIFTIDIVSCLIDYIKDNLFNKYLKKVFEILEDNNILTTLLEIKKSNSIISQNLVEEIITKYLDEITLDKNYIYESKFKYNYNILGFYNFYTKISDFIKKNITSNYLNNETKLRKLKKEDIIKIREFYDKEESSLTTLYKQIEENNKSIIDLINKIPNDLIFKHYITFYLQKYINPSGIYNKDDIYHKLIELLLKIRFNEEKKIIKGKSEINILLIKIIWMESNVNYILNIFNIFENAIIIYNNNENKLYNNIVELILNDKNKEDNIKYITYEKKNPEYRKEVNECYYKLLAGICYSITSDEIQLIETEHKNNSNELQIQINYYCDKLKEIYKILQNLCDDLHIFLIEMYIIDELIKVIELFKKNNIEKINEIKNLIRENAKIIQKYANSKDSFKLSDELCINFEAIYNLIIKDETVDKDKEYYNNLRYILFKEIKKISDISYRFKIFEKLLESNEMIKKSNDILQLLLENCFKKDKFEDNMNSLLNGEDNTLKLIEKKLNENNFVLAETLLYYFEKNSLIYLKTILGSKIEKNKIVNIEDVPFTILKDSCILFLNNYMNKPAKFDKQLKEICKLFCLGYIRTYCYTFIKMFNDDKHKYNNKPSTIIDFINGKIQITIKDKVIEINDSLYKMIRYYIYKILYNNYQIDVFINKDSINKYMIKDYKDFNQLIQNNKELININVYKIDDEFKTLKDENYDNAKKEMEKCKKDNFKNKIKTNNFDIEDIGIDNFYAVSYNYSLTNLQMDKSDNNKDFYKNICEPLFSKEDKLLFKAIQLFYEPNTYNKIKKDFKINSTNIKALLFGYRYCLNEIHSKNSKNIYYPLYDSNNLDYLKEKLYPGNDTKFNKVYSNIINHFKSKPDEGCYVCLCEKWYYHSVPSGFPGKGELNMKCPKCSGKIGSYENDKKVISIVKRDNYYRILKDKDEFEKIDNDKNKRSKMREINYLTLQEFKDKYINNSIENEKGVYITDRNNFINDDKIIRNLSQISYRLLNYILYSHLFFARLITDKNDFNKYLPQGMSWVDILNECWKLLKKELLKENIDSIEKFLNFIFIEIFPMLNEAKNIDKFEELTELEENLESKIQTIIKKYKEESNKNKNKKDDEDKTSFINILKEKYVSYYYPKKDFPFYDYFYYADYLNEIYINEKLKYTDENKYPILKAYLESKLKDNSDKKKNKYSLDNLNLFNKVLNLINEEYFNNISREDAERLKLKEVDVYSNNVELFNNFIKYYNSLGMKDNKGNTIKLSENNSLCDFFLDDDNIIGRTYKDIYKKFIKEQNEKIEKLLDMKNEMKNRINIQKINEDEIFT